MFSQFLIQVHFDLYNKNVYLNKIGILLYHVLKYFYIIGINERPLRKAPKIQLSIGDETEQLKDNTGRVQNHPIILTL